MCKSKKYPHITLKEDNLYKCYIFFAVIVFHIGIGISLTVNLIAQFCKLTKLEKGTYQISFVETPRKFVIAMLSTHQVDP